MEDELSESRLEASKLKTELVSEKSGWQIKLAEMQSRINEVCELFRTRNFLILVFFFISRSVVIMRCRQSFDENWNFRAFSFENIFIRF